MTTALPLLRATAGFLLLAVLLSPTDARAQVATGWTTVDLPALTSYDLYVPPGVDQQTPSPLIVFLHGAGSAPSFYRALLSSEADLVGAILALPRSTTPVAWGAGQDQALIEATLSSVQSQIAIDPTHISISGHSAGAAFGYLLAYGTELPFSAVFTIGAPFLPVSSIVGSSAPPIRMAYGTADPLYDSALPQLITQWDSLGVDYEIDAIAGAGHNDIPTSTVLAGFIFLLSQEGSGVPGSGCETTEEQLCLIGGRFKVTVSYTDPNGGGIGRVASMKSDGSGLFWFFDPLNWELLVKVLDGCSFNQKFWVLTAASTNLAYTVTVTDLETGTVKTYSNEEGVAAPAVVDLDAFATCTP